MGLGMPAVMWPDVFVETIVSQGYRVVYFDNRDSGGSSRLVDAPVPNIPRAIMRALLRLDVRAPYDLADMARDAVGVLDAVGADKAHVVGVSMGGMIAQMLAAQHPQRVRSLTSTTRLSLGRCTCSRSRSIEYRPSSVEPARRADDLGALRPAHRFPNILPAWPRMSSSIDPSRF